MQQWECSKTGGRNFHYQPKHFDVIWFVLNLAMRSNFFTLLHPGKMSYWLVLYFQRDAIIALKQQWRMLKNRGRNFCYQLKHFDVIWFELYLAMLKFYTLLHPGKTSYCLVLYFQRNDIIVLKQWRRTLKNWGRNFHYQPKHFNVIRFVLYLAMINFFALLHLGKTSYYIVLHFQRDAIIA
jgi:hypothetical protein